MTGRARQQMMKSQAEVKDELARIDSLLVRARGTQIVAISARRDALRWVLGLPNTFDTPK